MGRTGGARNERGVGERSTHISQRDGGRTEGEVEQGKLVCGGRDQFASHPPKIHIFAFW